MTATVEHLNVAKTTNRINVVGISFILFFSIVYLRIKIEYLLKSTHFTKVTYDKNENDTFW